MERRAPPPGCRRRSLQYSTTEALTPKVAHDRPAKSAARLGTVLRQCNGSPPKPWAQRNMTSKREGAKAPIGGHKTIHRRQVEIGGVGDNFQDSEFYSSRLGTLRHRGRFHIHRARAVSFAEPVFLFLTSDGCRGHQHSLAGTDFCPN